MDVELLERLALQLQLALELLYVDLEHALRVDLREVPEEEVVMLVGVVGEEDQVGLLAVELLRDVQLRVAVHRRVVLVDTRLLHVEAVLQAW